MKILFFCHFLKVKASNLMYRDDPDRGKIVACDFQGFRVIGIENTQAAIFGTYKIIIFKDIDIMKNFNIFNYWNGSGYISAVSLRQVTPEIKSEILNNPEISIQN